MDILKNLIAVLIIYLGLVDVQGMRRRRPHKDQPQVTFADRSQQNWNQIRGLSQDPLSGNCLHNLCTNVSHYPGNYIKNMMFKKKEFHRFFGSVIQPYHLPTLAAKSPLAGNKENEERNMCETVQFTYFPETALNRQRKRMVIVNVDKFRQAVSFETCVVKTKCFLQDHKPLGYETACKQQYNLIRLVSMTEGGEFTLDTFPIPSSCVCTYRRVVAYN